MWGSFNEAGARAPRMLMAERGFEVLIKMLQ